MLRKKIQLLLSLFIAGLIISGLTAFPLEWELSLLVTFCRNADHSLCEWLLKCHHAVKDINANYPFLSYGTDWLAFAHLIIAIAFIGPLKNPFRNIWVIEFGMIACMLVIPHALIAGYFREIPVFWRLIDCSFGIIGIIPLAICRKYIRKLETQQSI